MEDDNHTIHNNVNKAISKTLAIVMGGGKGSRLHPLTKSRAKPAVPLAGKYRIVDIPLSNCINSGIKDIYVLTQYNSVSLNRHISNTYKFDNFRKGFIEIIAAQQTPHGEKWFQGTADAVRQSLKYFSHLNYDYFLILSGDQLYTENMEKVMDIHLKNNADITISTIPVDREQAKNFGIMKINENGRIIKFFEKPKNEEDLDELNTQNIDKENDIISKQTNGKNYLASMGIYLFNSKTLYEVLDNDLSDFGKHIIPQSISKYNVSYYPFCGAWEDIGTIKAFYEANLNLTKLIPDYNFFNSEAPFFTNPRYLPASKVNGAAIDHALISDGCIITDSVIRQSIIGLRSIINHNCSIERSIIMGADDYEKNIENNDNNKEIPPLGIGAGTSIKQAIVDKNVRIGRNVTISPFGKPNNMDGENFSIRDGIIIIAGGSIIKDYTKI